MSTMGEVNEILITELRNKVIAATEDINSDLYHEDDMERIQNDDSWLRRFILHHEYDMDQAFHMIMDCLKWRKEFGVHDIKESNLPQNFFEAKVIYPYARDKDDNKILMFHIRMYHKDHETMLDMKRFLVYWMEKLERDEKGHPITVVFDMKDTGFSNMDMDFVKFFISLFKFYYPSFLGYLIVYEMPWILNTAWKLIKTWLSARAVEKIKFVNKSTIQEYVPPDQLPAFMGGTNTYHYEYEPNEEEYEFSSLIENNGPLPTSKKKVHFAEIDSDSIDDTTPKSDDENLSPNTMKCCKEHRRDDQSLSVCGRILQISPSEELIFSTGSSHEPCSTITLTNNTEQSVAFKVKTTSPEKYRVRPSSGIVKPHCQNEVIVQLQPIYQSTSLARDKFLIMALALECCDVNSQELSELWRCSSKDKIMEYKLRCVCSPSSPQNNCACAEYNQSATCAVSGTTATCKPSCLPVIGPDPIDRIRCQLEDVQNQLRSVRRLLIFLIVSFLLFIVIILLMMKFGIEPFVNKKTIVNSCIGSNIA